MEPPPPCDPAAGCTDEALVEPGVLLIADRDTNAITRWASGSGAGLGDFISAADAVADAPTGITFRDDGQAFVVNFRRGEVVEYDGFSGSFHRVFFHDSWFLQEPVAARFRNGDLFVLGNDTHSLVVLDRQGEVIAEIGWPDIRFAHDFRFGPDRLVYVATSWDSMQAGMVQVWDAEANRQVTTFGAPGELDEATALTFGPDGYLYVSDALSDRIVRFDPSTGYMVDTFIDAASGLEQPRALDFGAGGDLYVISGRDVLRFDGTTGEPRGIFVDGDVAGFDDPRGLTWRYGGVAARWLAPR